MRYFTFGVRRSLYLCPHLGPSDPAFVHVDVEVGLGVDVLWTTKKYDIVGIDWNVYSYFFIDFETFSVGLVRGEHVEVVKLHFVFDFERVLLLIL